MTLSPDVADTSNWFLTSSVKSYSECNRMEITTKSVMEVTYDGMARKFCFGSKVVESWKVKKPEL